MKKKLLILFIFASFVSGQWLSTASARSNSHSTIVHGYTRHNGTHVNSYHRTVANHTYRDNYSHRGNYNPWTHKYGTKRH